MFGNWEKSDLRLRHVGVGVVWLLCLTIAVTAWHGASRQAAFASTARSVSLVVGGEHASHAAATDPALVASQRIPDEVLGSALGQAAVGPAVAPPTVTLVPTPEPTATLVPTPVPTATLVPTPVPTATLVPTPEPTATLAPTPVPAATLVPTPQPTPVRTSALPAILLPPVPTVTPVPAPTVSPVEAPVVPQGSVVRSGPPGVVNQIPASAWRWLDAYGWRVEWRQGPGPGRVSEAQYATSTIVIWYDTARSDQIWAGAFAHELGHAVSFMHFSTQQMNDWNALRGLSSWRWVPGTPNDFSVGEGDFAEAFMSYLLGHQVRSVGGPLSAADRAWIAANTPF